MSDRQHDTAKMIPRIRAFAEAEGLWQAGQRLLVAVSGGPDSVALLHLLHTYLTPQHKLALAVAHIHHHLRPEADADAAFVEELAARLGLPYLLAHADVPARIAETGESVETAARELRYAALAQLAEEVQADRIVTGHTADDQAETVLMRLLRGTGPGGLAGIPPRRDIIIRPLLPVWRVEIMAYLAAHDLPYRTDMTNLSVEFTRNRLRHELLPHLETTYAPRLRERLARLADMARADAAVLDAQAVRAYAEHRRLLPDGVMLPAQLDLPPALTWRLWRLALAAVRGSLEDISYEHLAAIDALPAHGEVDLPGAQVRREGDALVFLPAPAVGRVVSITTDAPLAIPGEVCALDAGFCLYADTLAAPPTPWPTGESAALDAGAVHGPLVVRGWQPGDRYRPLGAPGARSLQDIFTDARVPRRLRGRVPVVHDDDGILWLAGFRVAERVKITPMTARCVTLRVEWEWNPWTATRFFTP